MICRVLAVLMLLVGIADAQIVRVTSESEPRQVCRIVNGQQQCSTVRTIEYGTGVVIDRSRSHDWILTAKHVAKFDTIYIHGIKGEVIARHAEEDLAIVCIPSQDWDVATLEPAEIGDTVYLDGLGVSGKADAKDHRQVKATITEETIVNHPSRDGDSGGPVSRGRVCHGIITHTSNRSTRFVPASVCLTFCRQYGCCRPPAQQRTAPLPPPDIPDRQKVQRIEQLETELAALKKRVDECKSDQFGDVNKKVDRLTVIVQELAEMKAIPGPPGPAGKDGRDGPIEVRILSINDKGERRVVRHMSFKAGEPIDLLFHERLLTGEEN